VFLIELSVDFRPKDNFPPDERLILREQMVGLLQRHHHWTVLSDNHVCDARFVVGSGNKSRRNYLFASPGKAKRRNSDCSFGEAETRKRIRHNSYEREIPLDATIYKGHRNDNLQVSLQHKIADRRNKAAGTIVSLSERERRARMEVEISGYRRLCEVLGVCTVQDLAKLDFRRAQKEYLSLWLPTSKNDPHEKGETWLQFASRGVYGVHHVQQLKLMEENESNSKAGKTSGTRTPRLRAGAGDNGYLVSWTEANNMIGKAIDKLQRGWSDFSFP